MTNVVTSLCRWNVKDRHIDYTKVGAPFGNNTFERNPKFNSEPFLKSNVLYSTSKMKLDTHKNIMLTFLAIFILTKNKR